MCVHALGDEQSSCIGVPFHGAVAECASHSRAENSLPAGESSWTSTVRAFENACSLSLNTWQILIANAPVGMLVGCFEVSAVSLVRVTSQVRDITYNLDIYTEKCAFVPPHSLKSHQLQHTAEWLRLQTCPQQQRQLPGLEMLRRRSLCNCLILIRQRRIRLPRDPVARSCKRCVCGRTMILRHRSCSSQA